MAEQLDLASAINTSRTYYRVVNLNLDWLTPNIWVRVQGSDGGLFENTYTGATATALMTTLNTSNNSITSLQKRILQKLVTDGILPAGTVTGTPS